MGFQFEQLTLSAERSLSFLMEDLARARREGVPTGSADDMTQWLNALQAWSAPIVTSAAGQRGLMHWLETVEGEAGTG
jgi:hypothetical protein